VNGPSEELGVDVRCGGATHRIRWTRHGLELLGHPGGRDEDDVLVALSGAPARCRRIEEAWTELDAERALELLDADEGRLAAIARRLPVALDQRERVRRRDDLSDEERAAALRGFDQMTHLAAIAALGPAFARRRALDAVDELWHRRTRDRRRRALVEVAARTAGASAATVVLLPTRRGPTVVVRIRGRVFGVVSRPWLTASAA
jgi:hypothetical protein